MTESPLHSTGYLLVRSGQRSQRLFREAMAKADMKVSHFGLLVILAHAGSLTQRELADASGIDPRNLAPLCDELVAARLATRRPGDTDRRQVIFRLTDKGREKMTAASTLAAEAERALLAGLSFLEREQLQKLLSKLDC
jgi:DNA-binding MarR family transcriptional regulator